MEVVNVICWYTGSRLLFKLNDYLYSHLRNEHIFVFRCKSTQIKENKYFEVINMQLKNKRITVVEKYEVSLDSKK